jgi:hypothetical protein
MIEHQILLGRAPSSAAMALELGLQMPSLLPARRALARPAEMRRE